jgi:hypothetical protein
MPSVCCLRTKSPNSRGAHFARHTDSRCLPCSHTNWHNHMPEARETHLINRPKAWKQRDSSSLFAEKFLVIYYLNQITINFLFPRSFFKWKKGECWDILQLGAGFLWDERLLGLDRYCWQSINRNTHTHTKACIIFPFTFQQIQLHRNKT